MSIQVKNFINQPMNKFQQVSTRPDKKSHDFDWSTSPRPTSTFEDDDELQIFDLDQLASRSWPNG